MKKLINKIKTIFSFIINTTMQGIYTYFIIIFRILNKIFKNKFDKQLNILYKKEKPISVLLITTLIFSFISMFSIMYYETPKKISEKKELKEKVIIKKQEQKVQRYIKEEKNQINFEELNKITPEIKKWLTINNTDINYPILEEEFKNSNKLIYSDLNNTESNKNQIYYLNNNINKLFEKNWYETSNKSINIYTNEKKYIYKIFSIYETNNKNHLKTNFINNEYELYLNEIKEKSIYKFQDTVNNYDKIITITEVNENIIKVIHAKKINELER